ncbi:MAG: hypothetical protein ACRDQ4_12355 [Pseudonocardiaceae bacterium]
MHTTALNRVQGGETVAEEKENVMAGGHQKKDDSDKYQKNGHDPDRGIPPETGGKHEKKDDDPEKKEK